MNDETNEDQTQKTRGTNGQFVAGHPPTNKGKGGRPSKAREAALLAVACEAVNADVWRQIVRKRVLDALGRTQTGMGENSTITDDPESTAQGRNAAAAWIRDTIIGKPTDSIKLNTEDDPYAQLAEYSDDELAAILEFIERIRTMGGGGDNHQSGVGTTEEGEAEMGRQDQSAA